MTSETDHPRQRTVAELLAEHGGGAATGRRSRRRAADGPDDVDSTGGYPAGPPPGPPSGGPSYDYAPPLAPDRRILREPVPQDEPPRRAAPEVRRPTAFEAPREIPRETPTDRMPRVPERGPQRFADFPPLPTSAPPRMQRPPMPDAGPRPDVGSPTGPWRGTTRNDDGGPPTQAGVPLELDDEYDDDRIDDSDDYDDDYEEEPRPRLRGVAGLRDERDADELDDDLDYDDVDYDDELDDERDDLDEIDDRPSRRRERADEPAEAPSWGAVIAQWIVGAIGGAVLWVAFRFLWHDFFVVAIFAALLVTVGLVLVVRHLLRTTDMRTTALAVGVGLLLTVSPVVLVLLGK